MKRLFQVISLVFAIALLSGCPDAKLPSPTPKVPEPKAHNATPSGLTALSLKVFSRS